jgi:hypothetical protein
VYVPHVSFVLDVCSKCFNYFRRMFHVFQLYVAMTIHVCFNSILHMLEQSDGCCRGDEMLGQGKGRDRDRAWRRTECDGNGAIARGGAWRGGGRSTADMTLGAQPGWGSSRGWSNAVTGAGSITGGWTRFASVGSDAKQLLASELCPDPCLRLNVRALALLRHLLIFHELESDKMKRSKLMAH